MRLLLAANEAGVSSQAGEYQLMCQMLLCCRVRVGLIPGQGTSDLKCTDSNIYLKVVGRGKGGNLLSRIYRDCSPFSMLSQNKSILSMLILDEDVA